MNYRKTVSRIILMAWSTIAVMLIMCSITLNNAKAKFLFETRIDYYAGYHPHSAAIGDLNGDGNLDLAVASGDGIAVLLGNGDGTLQSAVYYAADVGPDFLAIDDLNEDGNLDLAVANSGSDNVSVLLGNGDGSFQDAVNYDAGDGPTSLAIGDLNGDGDLDLAVTESNGLVDPNLHNVSVLLGNGDGTFQKAVDYSSGGRSGSVAIGDLDGDGDLDLAVVNGHPENVSVLLGNGDGSFQSPVNYGAGAEPFSVAIGDLNGDGNLDLTVANLPGVAVLLGNGDGTFQNVFNYNTGSGLSFVAIGDLNGDGDLDLAVTNGDWEFGEHIAVLLGNGDGSFQNPVKYAAGNGPFPVVIGDLKEDGNQDLAVANINSGAISVMFGNGDGTFQSAVHYSADENPESVAIGDLNGDGDLDLAVANAILYDGTVSVLLGNGDGSFQSAVHYGTGDATWSVAIGDLNGDGDPDLAAANVVSDNISILLGNGDGTFQSAVNYSPGGRSVAISDINRDGNLDLVTENFTTLGNGDGTFQSAMNYDTGLSWAWSVTVGNLNEDANPDLVVGANRDTSIAVLLGNGNGTFQNAVRYIAGRFTRSVAIGDLNEDGSLDLSVGNSGSGNVSVLLGNGDGSFQSPANYSTGGFGSPWSVAIDDLNGDGDLDLAVVNSGSNNVSVLLGNGDGSFQNAVNYGVGDGSVSLAVGDLNGDSGLDLAVANENSDNVSILINTGGVANLLYTPVTPCRVADTRKAGGIIGANTQRNFHVHGSGVTISAQGGNSSGCPAPSSEPLAALINLVAANPTGKGNLQAYQYGKGPGANLGVNFAAIGTNFVNAGTVQTATGSGPEITVTSRNSSTHTVIDVLGYYYPDANLLYTPVTPCRIADSRKEGGVIVANTERNFHVHGDGGTISAQGGNLAGCPATLGEPFAVHINMIAVNPTGNGNMQAFAVGDNSGANFGINFAAIGTNFANAGIVETDLGLGPEITVTARISSAHAVIDVLGYYYQYGDFSYTPVTPCRIVDTRKSGGMIGVNTERDFHVFGDSSTISVQGGNSSGCPAPSGEPLAAQINLVVANPTGKGNMQAYPLGGTPGANLGVNFAAIGTNFANAGTVQTATGSGPEITVTSQVSSAHAVIDVLGYYYPAP